MTEYRVALDGREFTIAIECEGERQFVVVGKHRYPVHLDQRRRSLRTIIIGNQRVDFGWQRFPGGRYEISVGDRALEVSVQSEILARFAASRRRHDQNSAQVTMRAPMPGLVVKLNVAPGDAVRRGDSLLYLYAMKVENNIKAPADAVVRAIHCREGQNVEKSAALFDLEPLPGA